MGHKSSAHSLPATVPGARARFFHVARPSDLFSICWRDDAMDFRQMPVKPLHDGAPVPVLGLGTAGYGSSMDGERQLEALESALRMGYRHIDTAEIYSGGRSETLIGEAIQGMPREELFITT